MSSDLATAISGLALLVTILGWSFTYDKQKKLESIRGDIQKIVSEHDIRFEQFHKRRVEVIEELYKRIVRIIGLLTASIRAARIEGEISPEEYRSNALKQFTEFNDFYYENRLYVNKNLRAHIEKFIHDVLIIAVDFGTLERLQLFISTGTYLQQHDEQRISMLKEVTDKINSGLPEIRDLIEEQMLDILEGAK